MAAVGCGSCSDLLGRPCHAQAELTQRRLERAGKLTSGLADEGVRWQVRACEMHADWG